MAAGLVLSPQDMLGCTGLCLTVPLTPVLCLQIASLLKDHERIQAGQSSTPSDDDSDIKKIKKVGPGVVAVRETSSMWGWGSGVRTCLC